MNTLELLDDIAACSTVPCAWQVATGYYASLGFARVNYGLTRFLTSRSIGDPEDALFLTTSDPAYAELYLRNRFYETTPMYRWSLRNSGATTWRQAYEGTDPAALSPEEIEAIRVNARFGITAGIAISFPEGGNRTKGALGLTADRGMTHDDVDQIWAEHRGSIMAVSNMMHLKIVSLPPPGQRRPLTARQREALEWVCDGKTAADIAILMSVTSAMVEKHLRLAREALNVETTAQAVAKATLMNLIFCRPAGELPPAFATVGKDSLTIASRQNAAR